MIKEAIVVSQLKHKFLRIWVVDSPLLDCQLKKFSRNCCFLLFNLPKPRIHHSNYFPFKPLFLPDTNPRLVSHTDYEQSFHHHSYSRLRTAYSPTRLHATNSLFITFFEYKLRRVCQHLMTTPQHNTFLRLQATNSLSVPYTLRRPIRTLTCRHRPGIS